jgi:two-component system, LytTR family, response regulator
MSAVIDSRLKVLIVDDEPLARENLSVLLAPDAEVRVVGACSGVEAVSLIACLRPDILFLDIQMPELDGFALLSKVGAGAVPAIVFVTAFDRYALRAFEVHALDYLLKPFTDARFASALARAKAQARSHSQGGPDPRIADLIRERRAPQQRFLIPSRDKSIVIEADQIDWIGAADYYVNVHCGGVSHLLRESMDEMERQLDPQRFARVHRSTIVNLGRVREVHPLFRGGCELRLMDGTALRLSRERRGEFEARFSVLGLRR